MTLVQKEIKKVTMRPEITVTVPDYLCFTANTANSKVTLNSVGSPTSVSLETSTDGSTWNNYNLGTTITLSSIGNKVYFRNTSETPTGFSQTSSNYYYFSMDGSISASGDVNSLLCKNNITTITGSYMFYRLFRYCTALTTCPKLSATTLKPYCYMDMFEGCTNLEQLPTLSAQTLTNYCYANMFGSCTKIKLSATQTGVYQTSYRIPSTGTGTTASNSFNNMFNLTGGTFTGTPSINTTYYTSNTVIDSSPTTITTQVEKVIRPVGWQPGPNTILYFPLKSDAVDVIHSVSMTTQGSVQWTTPSGANVPCAYFSSPGYFSKTTSTSYLVTGNGARTISGWIMLTGNCRTSVACYGTGSSNQMFTLYYNDGSSKWRFTQWGSGSSYGSTMSTNTWYNVVITYDGSTVKWYINSNLDVSWSRSLNTSNAKMFLAGDMSETGSATPSTGLQGYLSEVIFEDKAWTDQEVTDYYNLTKGNYGL